MKSYTPLALLGLVLLALLLYTCMGPTADEQTTAVPTTQAPAPTPDPPTPKDTTATVPARADARPVQAEATPTPPSPSAATATIPPASSPTPIPRAVEAGASAPVLGPSEALLVIDALDLEAGNGHSALLILPPTAAQRDSLRRSLRIELPDDRLGTTAARRGHPSSTINTPTAFGPGWRQVYAGVAYQNRIRYDDWRDGILTMGAGVGDPAAYAGLDVTLNILDTYDEFAKDRSLSLKLHRRLPFRSAVAVGYENIWHTAGTDGGSSRYVVLSKVALLRDRPTALLGSMVLNVGLGTDRFLPEDRFARGDDGANVFGSLALRLAPPVSAVANWTGQDLALGLSVAPVRSWPLVITPAVVDVTGAAGDGARFSVSAGLGYNIQW